jgi:PAS domain S-box-containing protein
LNTNDRASPTGDEDCFQQLADGAPVMIWMSGLDMGCFYFNRAWLDFRGRSLEQESGNNWAEGVHPEDLQRCVSHYVSCFERRIAFAMSYRLQHFSGRYEWILDRGAPHYAVDGSFLGFFGGCAEMEEQHPASRNAELGLSLAAMRDFAARVAAGDDATVRAATGGAGSLRAFARALGESHLERSQAQHAAAEMQSLAADMIHYRGIEKGACLPLVSA